MQLWKKSLLSIALVFTAAQGLLLSHAREAAAGDDNGVACVLDIVVSNISQTGVIVSQEVYQRQFLLQEGGFYFDDFSTRTRFKFFSASLTKLDGDSTVSINWFADVTVFNSVDFNTSVTLSDGQKRGESAGDNTVYTSNGGTRTNFSLSCLQN